jgi:hypothetical protein
MTKPQTDPAASPSLDGAVPKEAWAVVIPVAAYGLATLYERKYFGELGLPPDLAQVDLLRLANVAFVGFLALIELFLMWFVASAISTKSRSPFAPFTARTVTFALFSASCAALSRFQSDGVSVGIVLFAALTGLDFLIVNSSPKPRRHWSRLRRFIRHEAWRSSAAHRYDKIRLDLLPSHRLIPAFGLICYSLMIGFFIVCMALAEARYGYGQTYVTTKTVARRMVLIRQYGDKYLCAEISSQDESKLTSVFRMIPVSEDVALIHYPTAAPLQPANR